MHEASRQGAELSKEGMMTAWCLEAAALSKNSPSIASMSPTKDLAQATVLSAETVNTCCLLMACCRVAFYGLL